jgi:hypothetical protein
VRLSSSRWVVRARFWRQRKYASALPQSRSRRVAPLVLGTACWPYCFSPPRAGCRCVTPCALAWQRVRRRYWVAAPNCAGATTSNDCMRIAIIWQQVDPNQFDKLLTLSFYVTRRPSPPIPGRLSPETPVSPDRGFLRSRHRICLDPSLVETATKKVAGHRGHEFAMARKRSTSSNTSSASRVAAA